MVFLLSFYSCRLVVTATPGTFCYRGEDWKSTCTTYSVPIFRLALASSCIDCLSTIAHPESSDWLMDWKAIWNKFADGILQLTPRAIHPSRDNHHHLTGFWSSVSIVLFVFVHILSFIYLCEACSHLTTVAIVQSRWTRKGKLKNFREILHIKVGTKM